jgi:hypothetical protein
MLVHLNLVVPEKEEFPMLSSDFREELHRLLSTIYGAIVSIAIRIEVRIAKWGTHLHSNVDAIFRLSPLY